MDLPDDDSARAARLAPIDLGPPLREEWLTSAEAADLLGIGTRTLYRFIDEGRLVAYRFGRVIRLQRSDVDSFLRSCRIRPGSLDDQLRGVDGEMDSAGTAASGR